MHWVWTTHGMKCSQCIKSIGSVRVLERGVHVFGSAVIRHEYEPGAHVCLGVASTSLDCPLALFHRSTVGHAARRRGVRPTGRTPPGSLRQAPPPKRQTLHLYPVRLSSTW